MQTVFSKYVKEQRKIYKLSQVELAKKTKVGLRFVRELEQGKKTLRLDKINQVLELFGQEAGPVRLMIRVYRAVSSIPEAQKIPSKI
jgi:y4mF family transcriptional regulator